MSFVPRMVETLREQAHRPLLLEMHGAREVPFEGRALWEKVSALRAQLRRAKVKRGDRVALVAPNSAAWAAADLAILAEGAVCVPLYVRQAPHELAGMLRDCEPTLVIAADAGVEDMLHEAWQPSCPVVQLADAEDAAQRIDEPAVRVAPDELVTLIYTSGTSGEPKGVMITRGNVDFMLERTSSKLARLSPRPRGEDRVFHYLPWCFAGSRVMLWTQLYRGNPLWLSTHLERLVEEMGAAAPHYVLNVPTVLERIRQGVGNKLHEKGGVSAKLYDEAVRACGDGGASRLADPLLRASAQRWLFPKIRAQIGRNLEFMISGSAPLGESTERWFEMLGIPVYQIYGLTETTAIVSMDDPDRARPGHVGMPIDGCETRIGTDGELLCRGPHIFAGYWRKPEATAEVLHDGWFHTGDEAQRAGDGNLRILGRLKDVIVPESGHNIPPAKIEARLMEIEPAIEQVAVVGHARPYLVALVSGDIDEAGLQRARERLNEGLPHYMRLRKLHRVDEPFSAENGLLTANQKLRRKAIDARYRGAIERMYA